MSDRCSTCAEVPHGSDPALSPTSDGRLLCAWCGYWGVPPGPEREKAREQRELCVADAKVVVEESFGKLRSRCTWCGAYVREDAEADEFRHGAGCIVTTPLRKPRSGSEHVHRYLPSKGCSWKCACGDSFVSCVCGKCPEKS